MSVSESGRARRLGWTQFRLGSFLLVVTVAGVLAGYFGPSCYRWLRTVQSPPPPAFPTGVRFTAADELPAYYLEPAETPLD